MWRKELDSGMFCDPNDLKGTLESVLSHVKSCKAGVSDHVDGKRWVFGFECACGEKWLFRLMQYKNTSSGAQFTWLFAMADLRRAAAEAINRGADLADLARLECVHSVMGS